MNGADKRDALNRPRLHMYQKQAFLRDEDEHQDQCNDNLTDSKSYRLCHIAVHISHRCRTLLAARQPPNEFAGVSH